MTKTEIIKKVKQNNLKIDFEEVNIELCDTFMVIFYLNKLVELKLIEMDVGSITNKGFDLAIDLYDNGWEVDDTKISITLSTIFEESITLEHPLFLLCKEFRDKGYKKLKDSIDEYKNTQSN